MVRIQKMLPEWIGLIERVREQDVCPVIVLASEEKVGQIFAESEVNSLRPVLTMAAAQRMASRKGLACLYCLRDDEPATG